MRLHTSEFTNFANLKEEFLGYGYGWTAHDPNTIYKEFVLVRE
jgi:hypothetical protein